MPRPHRRSPSALVTVAVQVGCQQLSACGTLSTWRVDPADVSRLPTDPAQAVEAVAAPLVKDGRTPGLVVGLLLPDGTTRFFGYGTTGQGGDPPPGPDTLFAIGSLSKGMLGVLTTLLVQEGRLSWDDRLAGALPPGTPLSPDAARITLEQLATHTSGLPRQPMTVAMLTAFTGYLFTGENFYRDLDRAALVDYLADFEAPAENAPRYSNIGYGLLGHAVEQRTGRRLDDLLAERITGPLGLTRTGYDPGSLPGYDQRAIGHAGDQPKFIRRGAPVPDWRFTEILRGSAALYSTARDLLAFAAAAVKGDGSPLSRAFADSLRVRYPRPREAAAVAWIVDEIGDERISYQVGIVAGYTSYLAVNPRNRTAVVVLQNAFNWDQSVGHTLMLRLATLPPARSGD